MNIAVVVNPAARAGAHRHSATRAAERLRALGHTATMLSGGSADESRKIIRTALREGAEAVVVVGGDGTINLAAQELAGTGIPLGIVPAGTGNDFAAYLGIPQLEPEKAADVIHAGAARALDLARVDRSDETSRLFATVLASGFDAKVNDRANRMRWPKGDMRYNIAVLVEFLLLKPIPFTLVIDGARVDGPVLLAAIGNTRSYGGAIPICPDADASDGMLDVTVIRPRGRLRLVSLMRAVYAGEHLGREGVEAHRGRTIRVEAAGTAYADGDPIATLPVTVEVVPGALTVFAPGGRAGA